LLVANLVAAVVIFLVTQIRINGVSDQTNQTVVDLLLPTAILGALYAAVTGIALVALSRRDRKGAAPVAE
jgi:ABC-type arginine/histidine transport system permease subunit